MIIMKFFVLYSLKFRRLPRHVLKFGFRELEADSPETSLDSLRDESITKSRRRRIYMHLMVSKNSCILTNNIILKPYSVIMIVIIIIINKLFIVSAICRYIRFAHLIYRLARLNALYIYILYLDVGE
jgi:hypothetical protein